ncbi:MAG TPA: NADH-quinone oxidoreductase subunit A [Candidatus Kapabacteria bacterium]|nr:NADH-quinone oxidoreductase subunit A [Candidatus Kapabacteria bacterium]
MLGEFSHVFAFFVLAIIFTGGGIVTNMMIRPKKPNALKLSSYECGEDPIGSGWIKFNIRFYIVALIFILFDVEIVFLFPWALVYKQMGWLAYNEMLAFLTILIVGFAYAWVKGDLDWVRPKPYVADIDDLVTRRAPRISPAPVPANVMPMPVEELVN